MFFLLRVFQPRPQKNLRPICPKTGSVFWVSLQQRPFVFFTGRPQKKKKDLRPTA